MMEKIVSQRDADDGMEKQNGKEKDVISAKEEYLTMPNVSPIEIEKHLKGMSYPANKRSLIAHAKQQNASQAVLAVLRELREQSFNSPVEVNKAIGEIERK